MGAGRGGVRLALAVAALAVCAFDAMAVTRRWRAIGVRPRYESRKSAPLAGD